MTPCIWTLIFYTRIFYFLKNHLLLFIYPFVHSAIHLFIHLFWKLKGSEAAVRDQPSRACLCVPRNGVPQTRRRLYTEREPRAERHLCPWGAGL